LSATIYHSVFTKTQQRLIFVFGLTSATVLDSASPSVSSRKFEASVPTLITSALVALDSAPSGVSSDSSEASISG